MDGIKQKRKRIVYDRVGNATLLAEAVYKAAYSGDNDVSVIGASCEVLYEYLDKTSNMVSGDE